MSGGDLTYLLAPTATFLIAAGSPGPAAGAGAPQLWSIVAVCAVLGAAIYTLIAIGFSVPTVTVGYRRARRWLEAAFAGFFAYAGVRMIFWRADTP